MTNYLTLNLTPQEHQLLIGFVVVLCVTYLLRKLFVYVTSEGV
jgi:hypothetical protein